MKKLMTRSSLCLAFAVCLLAHGSFAKAQESTAQQEGLRNNPPSTVCLVNGRFHLPEGVKEGHSLLIEDGKIVQIGQFKTPPGAKVIDLAGRVVYPGFVDPYVPMKRNWERPSGTGYWNERITPEYRIIDDLAPEVPNPDDLRKRGITVAGLVPDAGIIRGEGAVVLLSNKTETALLNPSFGQHVQLTVQRRRGTQYPNSPMGAVALARQTMLDAQWYQQAWQTANTEDALPRPEKNTSLAALQPVVNGQTPIVVSASNELFALRADRFAREFGLQLIIKGSGNEYRRLADISKLKRKLILPIDFPKPPEVGNPEAALDVTLETLMHWDHAPANPGRLASAHVEFAITTEGSDDDFLDNLRHAVRRGLDRNTALAAITSTPAKMLGIDSQVGTIAVGKYANFVVMNEELWNDDAQVTHTLVAGEVFEIQKEKKASIAGNWRFPAGMLKGYVLAIDDKKIAAKLVQAPKAGANDRGKNKKESAKKRNRKSPASGKKTKNDEGANDEDAVPLKNVQFVAKRLTGTFNSGSWKQNGISHLKLVQVSNDEMKGQLNLPDGSQKPIVVVRQKPVESASRTESSSVAADKTPVPSPQEPSKQEASFAVNYPLGAYGVTSPPPAPESVLIKNVTVWTCGDRGIIEGGAVLFGDGLILNVYGPDESLPKADLVIDGQGQHLTPGIIDCHSHMATDSGVNESGQAITAEVRIGDMIDCDDINIYRQMAGGVTASNILHGSANPIGGQNQVIKLRWGLNDEGMKMDGAPQGIKFALGENVKQSNRPNSTTRYPQTRMGVEQLFKDAFEAGLAYRKRHDQWKAKRIGLPPRVDLELEALSEILLGTRWIHCHSYRQDEILALIRVLDEYEITIGSFQHILEGYKVADAMAQHGATGSAFSDWWAYKYEVIDGIPYAGALMHEAGVVVSFNSDDAELARHLNHEAAKAVRYGGVPEAEALKFVTLNPAKQLRIDDRVGSIEVGKDADLVLWSRHPLSNLARCEQTWIDGRKYFDRAQDLEMRQQNASMRQTLIQKILMSGEKMEATGGGRFDPAKLWPRYDEFCHGHHHGEHLHDEKESLHRHGH